MDSTLLAGIIGGGATIAAAILGKVGAFDKPFKGRKSSNLIARWDSTWVDIDDNTQTVQKEDFYITKQKGSKLIGYILKIDEPGKRWDFEGNFTNRFIQINYFPSKNAGVDDFTDYGCYFFDQYGDFYKGYSIGYNWDNSKISISEHQIKRHK